MTCWPPAALTSSSVVRTLVPVSVRSTGERGELSNRVSALLCDLPCGEDDPLRRLQSIRDQMDGLKSSGQAVGADSFVRLSAARPACWPRPPAPRCGCGSR